MEKSKSQMSRSSPSLAIPTNSLQIVGAQAREAGGEGGDPKKAQTKFKMTAYIRMYF